jgi:LPS O-antigen subunit length determinant protein (WzzB/FepE family)
LKEETNVSTAETGQTTGTKDKTYNIIWFTEACLDNALRLEQYIQDAERDNDSELADFFRKAQADSRKGGELGKQMLRARLQEEG